MKPPKLRTAWATLPLILSIITRSSLPIFFSSVPYTAVPSTLSLPIKETVSFDSRVDAVVMTVSFHGVGRGRACDDSQNANGVSKEPQGKFRRVACCSPDRAFRASEHLFSTPAPAHDRLVGGKLRNGFA